MLNGEPESVYHRPWWGFAIAVIFLRHHANGAYPVPTVKRSRYPRHGDVHGHVPGKEWRTIPRDVLWLTLRDLVLEHSFLGTGDGRTRVLHVPVPRNYLRSSHPSLSVGVGVLPSHICGDKEVGLPFAINPLCIILR